MESKSNYSTYTEKYKAVPTNSLTAGINNGKM
jgi:hypothetical protein